MIKIYIGPNGFGKTTKLKNIQNDLHLAHIPDSEIFFLQSEILVGDEATKDTTDDTAAMEYIIGEFLSSRSIERTKRLLKRQIDNAITSNSALMDSAVNSVLSYTGTRLATPFMAPSSEIVYKKTVSIKRGGTDFLGQSGSGQRMQLLLTLIAKSKKKYIFLDEPEKYSHPSMLNHTASLIRNLVKKGKQVYIATHSPKLISMIDPSFSEIYIINDGTHADKPLPFETASQTAGALLPLNAYTEKEKLFYGPATVEKQIKDLYFRDFLETLFTKKVYLCEGPNDKTFLTQYLSYNNLQYEDYVIFPVFGKRLLPFFEYFYSQLGIDFSVIIDEDDVNDRNNVTLNLVISNANPISMYVFSPKNIETFYKYKGDKSNILKFAHFIEKRRKPKSAFNIV